MPDPLPGTSTVPAASVPAASPAAKPAVSPVPAVTPAQQTPAAKPAVPAVQATPAAQPAGTTVPLHELERERGRRQELEAQLEGLRRQQPQQQQMLPQQAIQQHTPIAAVDPKVELDKLWDTDPRKAVQVEIMYAMDWRDRQEANLNQQADFLTNKYQDFGNYRSTALSYVRSLPAHQRGAPGILEASYFMVRGQAVDSIVQQRENEWMQKYQRGEITAQSLQQPQGSYSAPTPIASTELTPQQLVAAQRMHVDPAEYAKHIKAPRGGQ